MTTKENMNSIKKIARITGILFLIMAIAGPFSLMYVPSTWSAKPYLSLRRFSG